MPTPLPRPRNPLLLGVLGLLGTQVLACASGIRGLYDDEKDAALKTLSAPASWTPDIRLRLSQAALDDLVKRAVDGGLLQWKEKVELSLPLGATASITPKAQVTHLELGASSACEGCLDLQARLEGKARWSAAGTSGSLPFTARVDGTVSFALDKEGDGWALSGRLRDLDKISLGSAEIGSIDATQVLGGWVSQALDEVDPFQLGTVGGGDLPLAGARLATGSGDLELQMLSDVPERKTVSPGTALRSDWEVRIGASTLLGLARREAFETGPIAYDTAAIPTSLSVSPRGFSLGVRLWKLEGSGWWRDYSVSGDLSVKQGRLSLEPTDAQEGDKSQGAGIADPLALLAEGQILSAVEDGVRQTIPVSKALVVGKDTVKAKLQRVRGSADHVVLLGTIETVSSGALER